MEDFTGESAVVTGAGSGIGRALALEIARRRGRVFCGDIDAEAAGRTAGEIARGGGAAESFACDISDPDSCRRFAAQAGERAGTINLLCAHAGVGAGGGLGQLKAHNRSWLLAVNIEGMLNTIEAFLPGMQVGEGERHVMLTGSMAGLLRPAPESSFYAMTKYAVIGMAEALRADLAGSGVGVSVLCPGLVNTRIWASAERRQERFGGPRRLPPETGRRWEEEGLAPDYVARLALAGVRGGEFYILVPDEARRLGGSFKARMEELNAAFKKGLERLAAAR